MIVTISPTSATVSQADDCLRLHVRSALANGELARALDTTASGRLRTDGDIELDLARLRQRAHAVATSTEWPRDWLAMVEYARARGWLSADGEFLRAHVEAA